MDLHGQQQEVLAVLSARLRAGAITRRQFVQAASFFGIGLAAATETAIAAPARGVRTMAQSAAGEVRFLVAEAFWADWHPYLHTA